MPPPGIEGLPGNPATRIRRQEGDHIGDIGRLGEPSERNAGGNRDDLFGRHRGRDLPVRVGTGRTLFTVIRRSASSAAGTRTS